MAKVLVVEDEPSLAELYRLAFSMHQYTVELASDGEEALNKVKDGKPDVIVLDIMMPKLNGIQVLQRLKVDSEVKNIPVLALTNFADPEVEKQAMKSGADKYLIKSQHLPAEIVSTVQNILSSSTTN